MGIYIIFYFLLFLPGIFSIINFALFLAKGQSSYNRYFCALLDLFNLCFFPTLYFMAFDLIGDRRAIIFKDELLPFSVLLIFIITAVYFILTYKSHLLSTNGKVVCLILLATGIFLNLSLIYNDFNFLSFFNIPIITSFMMQIGIHSNAIISPENQSLSL